MTTCVGTTGVGKTCMVTAYYAPYGNMTILTEAIVTAVSAGCTLGGLDGMATGMHTPGQGVPATCSVMFSIVGCGSPFCGPAAGTGTVTCTVNVADGLPVELLEFSVDDEDEAEDDRKSGDRESRKEDD